MAEDMLDTERLRKITDEMITAITSPPFVEAMRTMKSTPEDQRLKVGAEILNPATLRAKGAPLPSHTRITSRYFETGRSAIEVAEPQEAGQPPLAHAVMDIRTLTAVGSRPAQAGVCACGGMATVCGGAGGSN